MEQIIKLENNVRHLAGIVPIAGRPLGFNMPWPDAMMPIAPDYLAVEKAAWECVMAGCSSVWIVGYMGTIPLLRKRIGDVLLKSGDAKLAKRSWASDDSTVNVYYIPIHPKDREKKDSLGWSVLYGANRAYCLCKMISRWVIPEKFFCSFPYGITDDEFLKNNRKEITSNKQIIFSHNGKTVKDGLYLNFTFNAEDFKKARDVVKYYALETWEGDGNIPISHRRKTLDLKIEQIFKNLDIENATVLECPWYHEIGSWDDYSKFIGTNIGLYRNPDFYRKLKRAEE